jgi:2'-5' RNA ligase
MRLFFALWPPAQTARVLADWAREVAGKSSGRATREETIHLTLAFLGEVPRERLPHAVHAATRVSADGFALAVDASAYWPHNRIVCAGPRDMPRELGALAAALRAALEENDIALERRAFAAHVTLVRRARDPGALPPLPAIEWPVREFVLVRSQLSREGSRYEAMERFALGA